VRGAARQNGHDARDSPGKCLVREGKCDHKQRVIRYLSPFEE
jgi:hypothetical protein